MAVCLFSWSVRISLLSDGPQEETIREYGPNTEIVTKYAIKSLTYQFNCKLVKLSCLSSIKTSYLVEKMLQSVLYFERKSTMVFFFGEFLMAFKKNLHLCHSCNCDKTPAAAEEHVRLPWDGSSASRPSLLWISRDRRSSRTRSVRRWAPSRSARRKIPCSSPRGLRTLPSAPSAAPPWGCYRASLRSTPPSAPTRRPRGDLPRHEWRGCNWSERGRPSRNPSLGRVLAPCPGEPLGPLRCTTPKYEVWFAHISTIISPDN